MAQAMINPARFPIRAGKQTISPAVAREWLSRNKVNRPMRRQHVEVIKAAIAEGRYHYTGEPIIFDKTDSLIDGQHRLTAIAEGKRSVEVNVVVGIDPEAQDFIDVGRSRDLSDLLHMKYGVPDPKSAGAAVRMLALYRKSDRKYVRHNVSLTPPLLSPTLEEGHACYLKEKGILGSMKIARDISLHLSHGRGVWALMHYLMSCVDVDAAQEVFDGLATGAGLKKGDAVLTLRNQLTARRRQQAKPLGPQELCVKILMVWDAYRDDKPLGKITIHDRTNMALWEIE